MEELVRLIAWIEELSPQIWAIYVHRQYVGAFLNFGWAIALLVGVFLCIRWARALLESGGPLGDNDELVWVPVLLGVALGVVTMLLLAEGVWSLLTPEYLAIKDLLSAVK